MRRRLGISVGAVGVVTALAAAPVAVAAASPVSVSSEAVGGSVRARQDVPTVGAEPYITPQNAKIMAKIDAYEQAHPNDYAGLEDLLLKYTGEGLRVKTRGMQKAMSGHEAQRYFDAAKKIPGGALGSGIRDFSVTLVAWKDLNQQPTVNFRGRWNFPDNWAGQNTPHDMASIGLTGLNSCSRLHTLRGNTYTYRGEATRHVYLKSANIGNSAPIFGVNDYTTGFVSQADHGYVNVAVTRACGNQITIGGDFSYEANAGGSLLNVSAGWGFLSVSYNGGPMVLQKGTSPVYIRD